MILKDIYFLCSGSTGHYPRSVRSCNHDQLPDLANFRPVCCLFFCFCCHIIAVSVYSTKYNVYMESKLLLFL